MDSGNQKLYRCESVNGRIGVVEATVIDRRRLWLELEVDGKRFKENGTHRWKPTVMEAIEHFVTCRAHCLTLGCMKDHYQDFIDDIAGAVHEAAKWGELVGAVNGLRDKCSSFESTEVT